MNKILKSIGWVSALNILTGIGMNYFNSTGNWSDVKCADIFYNTLVCLIGNTLPAIAIAALDKYGHSSLVSNKGIQYSLSAFEATAMSCITGGLFDIGNCRAYFSENTQDYCNELFSNQWNINNTSSLSYEAKIFTVNTIAQTMILKYIWSDDFDSALEQS